MSGPAKNQSRCVPLPISEEKPTINQAVWYAEGLRFECSQCGNCCSGFPGYVWVTVEEMQNIAAYLKLGFDDFTRRYVRRIGDKYSLVEKFNYDCTFLTRDAKGKSGCGIYPVRPMQCRTWPFWSENLKSAGAWKKASSKCPGMCDGDAPRFELDHIEACRQHPGSP